MDNNAKVNTAGEDGWTALHYASSKGHLSIAKLLIDRGADIHATNKDNLTPYHNAAGMNHLFVIIYKTEF